MNNVTSKQLLGSESQIDSKPNHLKLFHQMEVGKPYRPYQFKNITHRGKAVHPTTISGYLARLEDEGLIERKIRKGLIYWFRRVSK